VLQTPTPFPYSRSLQTRAFLTRIDHLWKSVWIIFMFRHLKCSLNTSKELCNILWEPSKMCWQSCALGKCVGQMKLWVRHMHPCIMIKPHFLQMTISHPCYILPPYKPTSCMLLQLTTFTTTIMLHIPSLSLHLRSSHKTCSRLWWLDTLCEVQESRIAQHTNNPPLQSKYGTWRVRCKSWNGITERQLTPLFKSPLGCGTGEKKSIGEQCWIWWQKKVTLLGN